MKNDIKAYLNQNKSKNFSELLFSYIDETGCKDSEIYKKVDIDRKLFSKIRCGDYIPKRSNVIKLCLSLRLDKVKFNNLLNYSCIYEYTPNGIKTIIKELNNEICLNGKLPK